MVASVIVLDLPYYVKSEYYYNLPAEFVDSIKVGSRVGIFFNRKKKVGIINSIVEKCPDENINLSDIIDIKDDFPLINKELFGIAEWMSNFYVSSLSEAMTLIVPSMGSPYAIKKKESVVNDEKKAFSEISFNNEQSAAINNIITNLGENKANYLYLRGVTGSGKTEVLLESARRAVDKGFSVLYLVPEIALTNQLKKSVLKIFNDSEIAVVHSNITDKMRLEVFRKCISGEIKFVLGTRSSAFSPLKNLKLIIIDEEQDQSYKDEKSIRFHARQVCQWRAAYNKSTLVFASATPSLECLKAIADNKIKLLRLTKRINQSTLPSIVTVIKEKDEVITNKLLELMKNEIDNGRSVVLFLNRRGFLYHYKCQSCGYEKICPDCSVSMTYHRSRNVFVCHRCKRESPYIEKCPVCGSENELYSGYGTEYVENVVKNLFPFSKVERMDADTTSRKGASERIIKDFEDGKINILIGTQMVSKGFNFRKLRLVGIINVSQNVMSSDFRQDEKLYSLLVQVAGRSGRFSTESKVVIQTDGSVDNVINYVKNLQDEQFYENEMQLRETFALPPYTRLARIVFKSKEEYIVKNLYSNLSYMLRKLIRKKNDILIINEGQCPIYKEAGYYRMQFVLKNSSVNNLINVLNTMKKDVVYKNNYRIDFDIDPYDFS